MAMNSNLSYFMERVQGVSSNIFRLEPQNSSRATPNSQIRFNLPSNCLLNFRSLRLMFNATTEGSAADGGARLPPKIDSLITRYEILAGGVQISQGFDLYNVFVQAKAVLMGSTCDATLGHPEMVRQNRMSMDQQLQQPLTRCIHRLMEQHSLVFNILKVSSVHASQAFWIRV